MQPDGERAQFHYAGRAAGIARVSKEPGAGCTGWDQAGRVCGALLE